MAKLAWMSVVALAFTAHAHSTEFGTKNQGLKSDSGIKGPAYEQIVAELDELARAYPTLAEKIQYGTTARGRPLAALKISRKSLSPIPAGAKAILIAGAIHGNEYLNVEDRLPRWFLETGIADPGVKKFLDDGGAILLAPILNPDGYANRDRENHNGKDLNRDFTVRRRNYFSFKETETKALSEFVAEEIQESGRKLAVTMDYHCCIGAVLRPWSFKDSPPPASDMARFDTVGRILIETFGHRYKYGTTPDILGYQALGTSKDYYYETYGAVALTFEGKYKEENQRFKEHTVMWQKIFAATNAGLL